MPPRVFRVSLHIECPLHWHAGSIRCYYGYHAPSIRRSTEALGGIYTSSDALRGVTKATNNDRLRRLISIGIIFHKG